MHLKYKLDKQVPLTNKRSDSLQCDNIRILNAIGILAVWRERPTSLSSYEAEVPDGKTPKFTFLTYKVHQISTKTRKVMTGYFLHAYLLQYPYNY